MENIIVVNRVEDFPKEIKGLEVVTVEDYFTAEKYLAKKEFRIYNLSQRYRYQSAGYYVSLLAEARGHRVWPTVTTIQDFKSQSIIRMVSEELDHLIQSSLKRISSSRFEVSIYFGQNMAARYGRLVKALYNLFEAPLLRAWFAKKNDHWHIASIGPIALKDVPESHQEFLLTSATNYFSKKTIGEYKKQNWLWVAILTDSEEKAPPSDKKALNKFITAARKTGIIAEIINKDHYSRLAEYDGLFIRATTSVNNFTYRFSRKAFKEGLAVIDDPLSILRCSNKVYLAELLNANRIPTPKTIVINKNNYHRIEQEIGFPAILKEPDSAFSFGVVKVSDLKSAEENITKAMTRSDLIIAQEFMPTDFDWRIGVLDGQPLFACKYFMARNHWQIYNWEAKGRNVSGSWETMPIEDAPWQVVTLAVKSASLIGDGFYGVDIKQWENEFYVIEINDNPSVEAGVEDQVLKMKLYSLVMESIKNRIIKKRVVL